MKQSKNRILVFGYFGYVNNQLDGQTVKTRAIYNLVKDKSDVAVTFADTQEFRHNPKSIFRFFRDLIRCTTLLWLPAHNNLKYLFPFIWAFSKLCNFDIVYIVIGGWLSVFLEELPFHRRKLKNIKAILLENQLSVKELSSKFGFSNLAVIPNFRDVARKPVIHESHGSLKLVFMARINKMKGLDTIAQVAQRLNNNITIDFYGPIHDADEYYFRSELIDRYSFINYRGVLLPEQIYPTLSKYDVMLFPTHYFTEGFPGSIMDAYRSAIPVIATNWKHAQEFIINGESGFIVSFEDPVDEMIAIIEKLTNNRELLYYMKDRAYQESLKYTPDAAWEVLKKYLES